MADKLMAEWFWTDRWTGSSGFLLPQEARGVYREMLTQAWHRGAKLPNDHEAIRRATGTTQAEWRRAWPLIAKYWRVDGESLVNDTQMEVYAEAQGMAQRAAERGRVGGLASAQARRKPNLRSTQVQPERQPENILERKPLSPSPEDPPVCPPSAAYRTSLEPLESMRWFDLVYGGYPNKDRKQIAHEAWLELAPDLGMAQAILTDIQRRVRHGWAKFERRFIPQLVRYLRERQWEDATQGAPGVCEDDPHAKIPHAWQCQTCGDVHEGTQEQRRRGLCLKGAAS